MLSFRIPLVAFWVLQISLSSCSPAKIVDFSSSALSSRSTSPDSSSTQASRLKRHSKRSDINTSCTARKTKKHSVRVKLDAVVANSNNTINSVDSTSPDVKSGDATYYATGLGACGTVSNDDSMIAAASHLLFDTFPGATANPNLNPICGRKVKATYEGKSVEIQIVDRCTGCAMYDLDFSPTAFSHLGKMEAGRLHGMKWEWI